MEKINWEEWEEITREEYREIESGVDVMWIMFHNGSDYKKGYYFKRRTK